jgi:hypothetical protein
MSQFRQAEKCNSAIHTVVSASIYGGHERYMYKNKLKNKIVEYTSQSVDVKWSYLWLYLYMPNRNTKVKVNLSSKTSSGIWRRVVRREDGGDTFLQNVRCNVMARIYRHGEIVGGRDYSQSLSRKYRCLYLWEFWNVTVHVDRDLDWEDWVLSFTGGFIKSGRWFRDFWGIVVYTKEHLLLTHQRRETCPTAYNIESKLHRAN